MQSLYNNLGFLDQKRSQFIIWMYNTKDSQHWVVFLES